jgi:hypothetical protein
MVTFSHLIMFSPEAQTPMEPMDIRTGQEAHMRTYSLLVPKINAGIPRIRISTHSACI